MAHALKATGRLLHQEQYPHEYPFCWRAKNDPRFNTRDEAGLSERPSSETDDAQEQFGDWLAT